MGSERMGLERVASMQAGVSCFGIGSSHEHITRAMVKRRALPEWLMFGQRPAAVRASCDGQSLGDFHVDLPRLRLL